MKIVSLYLLPIFFLFSPTQLYPIDIPDIDPKIITGAIGAAAAAGSFAVIKIGQWLFGSTPPPANIHITTFNQHGSGTMHATNHTKASSGSEQKPSFLSRLYEIPFGNYTKGTLAVAATGYCYGVYQITSMQRYLLAPERISLWFKDIEFSKLLLLEQKAIQELITQEFITIYKVKDQKELKSSIFTFMQDLETELACLTQYQTFSGRVETVTGLGGKCISTLGFAVRTLVPISSVALDIVPSISTDKLFFMDSVLKKDIQERIARLHYYKNIFLQSSLVI